jgi:catechol 2,3-dioxygenase-like lactoylglutathione lyase family enzyme
MESTPASVTSPLAVVAIWAPDEWKAAHFYRETLGLKLMPVHDRPHFDLGGTFLTILRGEPRPADNATPARFPILAFRVKSLEDAVSRLRSAGAEMPWGIEGQGSVRYAMFKDPAGNIMEVVENV